MKEHRYILEPYKGMNTRYRCPSCHYRERTFSRYIDKETGEHIHPNVGRCNRESNCGHHYTPKQYFQDNNILFKKNGVSITTPLKNWKQETSPKAVSFIPVELFKASLNPTAFETNHFVQFLINLFGVEVASRLVSRYFIATSKHWNGATVFWQIDRQGKVRTGKIMLYSPTTGKRVKEPFNHINWVHKALKQPEFELRQCLFGEHLLIDKTKPVAIVESEKTAVIASVYLPQFIWVAVGSLTNLNAKKCSILKGRTVTLFPDLKEFDKWSNKAKELSHIARFQVSDLLERKATEAEKRQGLDLADYLIRFDFREFALPETEGPEPIPPVQTLIEVEALEPMHDPGPPAESLQPVESGTPEPQSEPWKPTPEEMERLRRTQAVIDQGIEDRIRQVEASQYSLPVPDAESDNLEMENYFTPATMPAGPIRINAWTILQDPIKAVRYHLAGLKASPPASPAARADQIHLRQLKAALEAGKSVLNHAIHT